MKTISIFLALINSLTTILLLAYTFSPEKVEKDILFWLAAKGIAGSLVIIIGIITWLDCIQPVSIKHMVLFGLFLTMLGVGSATWFVQLGLISGDMLNTLLVYGCSLTIQGITSLLSLLGEPRITTS